MLRCLLGRIADDVIAFSDAAIKQHAPQSSDDVRRLPALIAFSPDMAKVARELLTFLYNRLYHHPAIAAINRRSGEGLTQLFELLVGHPHLLSPQFETRVKKDGVHRATCDYLACLTDRQVYVQHQKLIGGLPSIDKRAAAAAGVVVKNLLSFVGLSTVTSLQADSLEYVISREHFTASDLFDSIS